MQVAFIKNKTCFNIAEFDSAMVVQEFQDTLHRDGLVDTIVVLPDGYGIGDKYEDGVWTKAEPIPEPQEPTIEERIQATEEAINFMLGL